MIPVSAQAPARPPGLTLPFTTESLSLPLRPLRAAEMAPYNPMSLLPESHLTDGEIEPKTHLEPCRQYTATLWAESQALCCLVSA